MALSSGSVTGTSSSWIAFGMRINASLLVGDKVGVEEPTDVLEIDGDVRSTTSVDILDLETWRPFSGDTDRVRGIDSDPELPEVSGLTSESSDLRLAFIFSVPFIQAASAWSISFCRWLGLDFFSLSLLELPNIPMNLLLPFFSD